ncbi:MAG: SDR family oxidoreductase [Steroidobacteraceae bacterium]|nr:SDR family oxidoreductase [Steroidobacteraceae bacterium]MDW8258521.1 SDR family NAD(P)-dependent oxidoreductase [Gammaproteobacteria bacterium]
MRAVAFITGAAGGIGRATVAALRAQGMLIAAADRQLAELPCADPDLLTVPLDVTDETAVNAAVARVLQRFGRLDHAIHLAGRTGAGPLRAESPDEWRALLEVNLTSAFLLARAVADALAATRGSLTLMASTNGRNGGSALSGPAYAVSKAGVINLMRYLAKEWAPQRVRVNAVAPGPIDTPMVSGRFDDATLGELRRRVPLGRLGTASEVAAAIAYLVSPGAGFVTGAVLNVSGGLVLD